MPSEERIRELKEKYAADRATDAEIRELFLVLGENDAQIQHRIDIERESANPEVIV